MSTQPPVGPVLSFPPEVLLRAQGVRLALFDVDGVLTDGGLYVGADGEPVKRFHTLDGLGLKLLGVAGIRAVVISGRDSPALRQRLRALGVDHATLGCDHKLPAAQHWLDRLGVPWPEVAAIGDDWPDLPLLGRAAFAAAPPQAHPEVRARVHWTTTAPAGGGAAREFCDLLLVASGRYHLLLEQALAGAHPPSDPAPDAAP